MRWTLAIASVAIFVALAGCADNAPRQLAGVVCQSPPPSHCPDAECPAALIGDMGNALEPKTQRKFFLDYPCDLKPHEKVTVVLSLHGGGSIGNWTRHYFPIMDLKEKYRLVIATPSSESRRGWDGNNDDEYLQNVVSYVFDQVGKDNIKAFWLAGHSQGGMVASRLICTDFYRDKVTGWVSLSGGRAATARNDIRVQREAGSGIPVASSPQAGNVPAAPIVIDKGEMPSCEFSNIYESGEHEIPASGFPNFSRWAEKLQCDARVRRADIVDTKAGYVYDTRELQNRTLEWGGNPAPGTAQVYEFPNCKGGRVVADLIRMDKGHTQGLEPNVTEEIVKLMMSAK